MTKEQIYYATTQNKDGHTSVGRFESEDAYNQWYDTQMTHLSETKNSDVYTILYNGYDKNKAEDALDMGKKVKKDKDLEDVVDE